MIEQLAELAHEVNRAYCLAINDPAYPSQPSWADASEEQRTSLRNGVKFLLADPTRTPEQSHENWLTEKRATGWVYGPVKDQIAKTHPCFMPYNGLPIAQRAKDHLFRATVLTGAKLWMAHLEGGGEEQQPDGTTHFEPGPSRQ